MSKVILKGIFNMSKEYSKGIFNMSKVDYKVFST